MDIRAVDKKEVQDVQKTMDKILMAQDSLDSLRYERVTSDDREVLRRGLRQIEEALQMLQRLMEIRSSQEHQPDWMARIRHLVK
jgi:hypothetical protein